MHIICQRCKLGAEWGECSIAVLRRPKGPTSNSRLTRSKCFVHGSKTVMLLWTHDAGETQATPTVLGNSRVANGYVGQPCGARR